MHLNFACAVDLQNFHEIKLLFGPISLSGKVSYDVAEILLLSKIQSSKFASEHFWFST